MKKPSATTQPPDVGGQILTVRGQRVILDSDLATLYGVPTKRLNEQYRRNRERFPEDFAFQLTPGEWTALRSNISATTTEPTRNEDLPPNRSQIATGSQRHRGTAHQPNVFTEHGALMAANVLNSAHAITMSVYLIRAFVKMREEIATNIAILKRLAEIDKSLLTHDVALRDIYQKLIPLLRPPPLPPKPEIGFHIKEAAPPYRVKRLH
jgi:hypothetical protein